MNLNQSNTISDEISSFAQQLPIAEQKAILIAIKKRAILERARKIDKSSSSITTKLTTQDVVDICRQVRTKRNKQIK